MVGELPGPDAVEASLRWSQGRIWHCRREANIGPKLPCKGPRPQLRPRPFVVKSGDADVLGLWALGALDDVELDLLVLVKRLVAAGLNGGEVDEHVFAAAVLRDETEPLVGVEPLNGSLSHDLSVPSVTCRRHRASKPLKTSTLVLVSSEPKPGVRDTSRGLRTAARTSS